MSKRQFSRWGLWLCICCALWLSGTADAQSAPSCEPRITGSFVAKAQAKGPPPIRENLDWQPVTLRHHWRDLWPDYDGAAWYRIDWELPCADQPVALMLKSIVMAGEVFANESLLWQDAHLSEPLSRSWNKPRYWLLPQATLQPGRNQIWIRVHGRAGDSAGMGAVKIGDPQRLHEQFEQAEWSDRTVLVISVTVSLVLSVLFGFAWLQNRSHEVFGWYALNALLWALLMGSALSTSSWPFPSSAAVERATALIFMAFALSFCLFVWRFAGLRLPRTEWALWSLSALVAAGIIFTPQPWLPLAKLSVLPYLPLVAGICLWFPWHAWKTRRLDHAVFAACVPIFLILGLHDFLHLHGFFSQSHILMPYSIPVTMLALALVLGRQLTLNMQRIEQFNVELTDSITRACEDLSSTLEREHSLAMRHNLLQERMQISHDLHDSLGGSLVRSIAYVEQSRTPLPNTQVLSMLKLMRDDLRQMIDNGASANLQVPETPAQWIAPLRHRFSMLFEELDLKASWNLPAHWQQCPSAIQCLTLTRVLEEALTNVIKHSRASQVSIALELHQSQELKLVIADNGLGFDVHSTQINSMGVGMRSMLARMERVHGSLLIQSKHGHTMLQATMSLDSRSQTSLNTEKSTRYADSHAHID